MTGPRGKNLVGEARFGAGRGAPSVDEIARLSAAIVAAGRRLGSRGLIAAAEGNLSLRLDSAWILVTPSGLRKDELEPEDLVVAPLDPAGPPIDHRRGRRATSDLAIHRALYAARSDVNAVVHAHVPASMALTLAGLLPDPTALPETAFHLPRLPFVPFAEMGSEALARRIAAALSEPPLPLPGAALLERHGAVAVGTAPDDLAAALAQAVDRLELVDVLCRVWRDATLLGRASHSLD